MRPAARIFGKAAPERGRDNSPGASLAFSRSRGSRRDAALGSRSKAVRALKWAQESLYSGMRTLVLKHSCTAFGVHVFSMLSPGRHSACSRNCGIRRSLPWAIFLCPLWGQYCFAAFRAFCFTQHRASFCSRADRRSGVAARANSQQARQSAESRLATPHRRTGRLRCRRGTLREGILR